MKNKTGSHRKGGRPRKTKDEQRRFPHKISYTATEEETVKTLAEENDQSLKDYLHDAPLNVKVKVRETDLERDLKRNLSAIGNNINQIAYHANVGNLLSLKEQCMELVLLLKSVLLSFLEKKGIMVPQEASISHINTEQQNAQQNGR